MSKKNIDIRLKMMEAGIKSYQVAEQLNISEEWFSKLLRHELPEQKKQEIFNAIKSIK